MTKLFTQKFYFRIFVCFFLFSNGMVGKVNGQMVYVADSMFRMKLTNLGFGSCMVGDSIDSSCPTVVSTTTLDISSGSIQDIEGIQAFTNLSSLDCHNNLLTSFPVISGPLNDLDCSYNQITVLPALPPLLTSLLCENNLLDSLPALTGLTTLYCQYNHLTSLPPLAYPMTYLECSGNQLTSLPALPTSLVYLSCQANQLTSLPVLPDSLVHLSINGNQVSSLPVLPDSLTWLDCSNNPLLNLPALPVSLTFLDCQSDQLTNLPALPVTLTSLLCGLNSLTSLPALPGGLTYLNCYTNQLTNLPSLPVTLTELNCPFNQLSVLPALPVAMNQLNCSYNLLTSIPELPDSLLNLTCNDNPTLFCLPRLKRIVNLDFTNTGIGCLPDYGNVTSSTPPLASVPLCGVFNPNGCDAFWNISGKTYFDSNVNCLFDSADVAQPNEHVMLYHNGTLVQQTFTGADGYYSFDVNDTDVYEVRLDTNNSPFSILCPASFSYMDTLAIDSLSFNNDFALLCNNAFDVGAWSVEGFPFRPAHTTALNIGAGDLTNFFGVHCAGGLSGSLTIVLTGPAVFVGPDSGALVPDYISGDTVSYNISDFGNIIPHAFNVIIRTDTFAVNGSQICFTVSVSPVAGDYNPANNILTQCFNVRASFDPNDKEVYPPGDLDTLGNRWLTYTIHFQNTGSADAEHIYLIDTLDANLDLSSFQLLGYSHLPLVQILDGGIVKFNFPNINLPDSNSNEPASHGYVQYKLKMKSTTNVGTQIKNTAYIYFDFNAPVATNTVVNNVTNIVSTGQTIFTKNKNEIKIYPNPTTGNFTISFANRFGEKASMKIYNLVGENIFEKNLIVSSTITINQSEIILNKGMYVLEIIFGNYSEKKKLIVE